MIPPPRYNQDMAQHIGSFTAVSEDGTEFEILLSIPHAPKNTFSGQHTKRKCPYDLKTSDGVHVTWESTGAYLVHVPSGPIRATSEHPAAP